MQAGKPVLRMPGSNDLSVLELMNVDRLDCHLSVLRREPEERIALRTCNFGANDHLVSVLQHLLHFDRHVGKRRSELGEDLLRASGPAGWPGAGGNSTHVSLRIRSRSAGSFRSNA